MAISRSRWPARSPPRRSMRGCAHHWWEQHRPNATPRCSTGSALRPRAIAFTKKLVAIRRDVLEQRIHRDIALVVLLLDDRAERRFSAEHREDVVARDELEVLEDLLVRRVRDRHREHPPLALERQDRVLHCKIRRHQAQDFLVDLELGEVDGRHLVRLGDDLGELDFLDRAGADQCERYRGTVLFGVALRALEQLARNNPLFHQERGDALGHRGD
jgi:hypothetical protein